MNEELNPFEYLYKPNDVVEIPANALLNIMHFCTQVIESQPNLAVPYVYAEDVVKHKDGSVSTKWAHFDKLEHFLQTIETPIPVATKLTIQAEQVFYAFNKLHQENIEKGIASKPAEFEPLNNKKDEPSVLDNTDKK